MCVHRLIVATRVAVKEMVFVVVLRVDLTRIDGTEYTRFGPANNKAHKQRAEIDLQNSEYGMRPKGDGGVAEWWWLRDTRASSECECFSYSIGNVLIQSTVSGREERVATYREVSMSPHCGKDALRDPPLPFYSKIFQLVDNGIRTDSSKGIQKHEKT